MFVSVEVVRSVRVPRASPIEKRESSRTRLLAAPVSYQPAGLLPTAWLSKSPK
jgi:hypothetical protein